MKTIHLNDTVTINLVCLKSKISPLKPIMIPWLELCAALLPGRMNRCILDSIRLSLPQIVYWCDSSIKLSRLIRDTTKLNIFVANKVREITKIPNKLS